MRLWRRDWRMMEEFVDVFYNGFEEISRIKRNDLELV